MLVVQTFFFFPFLPSRVYFFKLNCSGIVSFQCVLCVSMLCLSVFKFMFCIVKNLLHFVQDKWCVWLTFSEVVNRNIVFNDERFEDNVP